MRFTAIILSALLAAPAVSAGYRGGVDLDVVVGGMRATELHHAGTTYVEAIRGKEYSLRLTNPTPHRVAVALSVDGLNTINAKHTDPWSAAKWVLDPWETVEIEGWQVNDATARRFFFTGENNSYGAALGEIDNLGVIEAVFYRERPRPVVQHREFSKSAPRAAGAPAPSAAGVESQAAADDAYAATGMGDRTRHDVREVEVRLEREPIASVRIRYEFRPQLVKLGVLPRYERPLDRRERSRGFEDYCPEP